MQELELSRPSTPKWWCYWNIDRLIVEEEQRGAKRAEYWEKTMTDSTLHYSQLAAQCLNNFFNGFKFWRAVWRQSLVKILTTQVRLTGDFAHALGFGHITNGRQQQFAVSLGKSRLKILMDHFRAVQIFAGIPFFGGHFHGSLLQFFVRTVAYKRQHVKQKDTGIHQFLLQPLVEEIAWRHNLNKNKTTEDIMQRNAKSDLNIDSLVQNIGALAGRLQKLTHLAESQFATEVETIIDNKSHDSTRIERCLDGLVSFCFDDNMPALYKKRCRYYYDIDPEATISYINAYGKMGGNGSQEFADKRL